MCCILGLTFCHLVYRAQKDTSDDKCDDGGSGDSPQENEPGKGISPGDSLLNLLLH